MYWVLVAVFIALIVVLFYYLMHSNKNETYASSSTFPRIIWTYWATPNIPPFVTNCINTWRKHNPSYTINIVTRENLYQYTDLDIVHMKANDSPARESDFVRLAILVRYGGFWIDASTICTRPLDWIQTRCVDKQFFAYFLPGFTTDARYPVIESWMFACVPNSPFVRLWRDEFMRTNTFDSISAYVESVKSSGVDLQNISMPEYLAIHLAAQKTLQLLGPWNDLEIVSATQPDIGPFYFLDQHGWNSDDAVAALCAASSSSVATALIKFRGMDRKTIEQRPDVLNCLF